MEGPRAAPGALVTVRRRWPVSAAAAVALLGAIAAWLGLGVEAVHDTTDAGLAVAAPPAEQFLARYVAPDGRVVRRDQGGDVVSEGQAYAMLISATLGDRATFGRVWRWTRAHLQAPTKLLASRWTRGAVADRHPAADADVDAAHALILAGRRFRDPALGRAGKQIAAAILARETVTTSLGPVLVAGPWAVRSRIVNPSYFSPTAFRALGRATGDPRWGFLEFTSYRIVDHLTSRKPNVAPDWATVDRHGRASPSGKTRRQAPVFGFEAIRVPIRMAASGTQYGRGLAARMWHFFSALDSRRIVAVYGLDGRPRTRAQDPGMYAAGAASAAAAGEPVPSRSLMARATALDAATPTYYGGAWLALTDLVLSRAGGTGPV